MRDTWEVNDTLRQKFVTEMLNALLRNGGTVTFEGVRLKIQGKFVYDFVLYYMEIYDVQGVLEFPLMPRF